MATSEFCQCNIVDEETVLLGKKNLIEESLANETANLFKVLGDSTRVKILQLLSVKEMCVCDISIVLGMTQSAISHQLSTLRHASLVKNRKDGKVAYYSLDDQHVLNILNQGIDHISHR